MKKGKTRASGPLRRLREKAGLSQYDVAVALGRHQPWVSLVERGYVRPTDDDVRHLARLLDVAPSGLGFHKQEAG